MKVASTKISKPWYKQTDRPSAQARTRENRTKMVCKRIWLPDTTAELSYTNNPSMVQPKETINEFMSLTNCTKDTATKYLSRNSWALSYALNEYYDKEQGGFVNKKPVKYSRELVETFDKYADSKRCITVENLMKYIEDLGYCLEDLATICLAELLKCEKIGKDITEQQFLSSWTEHGCKNMIHMKHELQDLEEQLHQDQDYFSHIYNYTYDLIVEESERHLNIDTAVEYWELFFDNAHYAVAISDSRLKTWIEFYTKKSGRSTVTKDTWTMFLKFVIKFPDNESLKRGYDEMDAWPLVFDEYYEYMDEALGIL